MMVTLYIISLSIIQFLKFFFEIFFVKIFQIGLRWVQNTNTSPTIIWIGRVPPGCRRRIKIAHSLSIAINTIINQNLTMLRSIVTTTMATIAASTTLVSFLNGASLKRGKFTNSATGESFESLIKVAPEGNTFIGFSSKMGPISNAEIKAEKDTLLVVTLDSGYHCLCRPGENSWEDVL